MNLLSERESDLGPIGKVSPSQLPFNHKYFCFLHFKDLYSVLIMLWPPTFFKFLEKSLRLTFDEYKAMMNTKR